VTNEQPADPFGAVLARQMDEANASAPNTPSSAAGLDTKATTDSDGSTGKNEQDQVSAADSALVDPANTLAVMLQLPQEIKTSVAKDAASSTATPALEPGLGKAEANQLANNIGAFPVSAKLTWQPSLPAKQRRQRQNQPVGASPINAKLDLAAIASGKSSGGSGKSTSGRISNQRKA